MRGRGGSDHHGAPGWRPGLTPAIATSPSATITPGGGAPVEPTTPIVVTAHGGTLSRVDVINTASRSAVTGSFSADRLRWSSSEALGYGAHYAISATTRNTAGTTGSATSAITTITPAAQAYANLIPAPNTVARGGIGVAQPIVFRFTKPVSDKAQVQAHLHVTSSPPQAGAWYWIDSKTVHYRPRQFWTPGTTIAVSAKVYGLNLGGGVYGAEDHTATYHVHESWIATANGASKQMEIRHNGALVTTMPISLGAPATPTHSGIHVVSSKQPSIVMDSCTYGVCQGQPGYYKETVQLDARISNDGEFVHAAPWSNAQQGHSNVSHGCVNLSPTNAQWFYDHFGLGDVVTVTNSGGPPLPVWDTYGDWALSWAQWQAGAH